MRTKATLVVVVPIGALLVAFALLTSINRAQQEAQRWVEHTLIVRQDIASLFRSVLQAESDIRGLIVTRRPDFAESLPMQQQDAANLIADLRRRIADNVLQLQRLAELEQFIDRRFAIMRSVADLAAAPDEGTQERITALVMEGNAAMAAVRGKVNQLDAEEARLQSDRVAKVERVRDANQRISAATVALGVLGGIGSVVLLTRGIVRRVRALERNAARLAQGLPLLPSAGGRDEIGDLERRLQATSELLASRGAALEAEKHRLSAEVEQRKRAEEALLRTNQELESASRANELVMQNSRDVICMIDRDGRFSHLSAASDAVWGFKPSELIGQRYIDLVEPADREKTNEAAAEIMSGHPIGAFENCYLRKDGSLVHMMWSAYWSDTDETMFCVARDVTEAARGAKALNQAREEADRANRAKSEFLSRMSHELRTPLNAILGFGQLLEEEDLLSAHRESAGMILTAGRHLLGLINEVLDISRIESGGMPISLEPVLLVDAIQDAVSLLRQLAAERQVTVHNFVSAEENRFVLADRQRLKQVLLNLLSNATKYNRPGGEVTIRSWPVTTNGGATPDRLRIEITDSGIGIGPESLERLFTPFDRLGAEQTDVEGTGLGLALSKRLVELMGGSIEVASDVGRGTTFTVELALAAPPDPATEPAQPEQSDAVSVMRDQTILYVEDNLSNLRLIERVLSRRPNLKLIAAMQGHMGLELAALHRPDLILLDLHLPDISGWEVLHRLRADERTRTTPIFVVSADATAGQIQRSQQAGAAAFLTKPIDIKELMHAVNKVLNSREARDEK